MNAVVRQNFALGHYAIAISASVAEELVGSEAHGTIDGQRVIVHVRNPGLVHYCDRVHSHRRRHLVLESVLCALLDGGAGAAKHLRQ